MPIIAVVVMTPRNPAGRGGLKVVAAGVHCHGGRQARGFFSHPRSRAFDVLGVSLRSNKRLDCAEVDVADVHQRGFSVRDGVL